MIDAMERLEELLAPLGESAAFLAHGTLPAVLPGLEVEGAGSIGMPVSEEVARRIIAAAEQAPFGRGEETVVDTDVRRVWQLAPTQFKLRNPSWDAQMLEVVAAVQQQFALSGTVRHELYKLLIYEQGSFFVPHRDTEKTEGMFATLVVCLPSRHEGGTLIVEHDGEAERIDFGGPQSEFRTAFAAFYADCRHEITPVLSGYRVCLVYNLALDQAEEQPSAPATSPAVAEAADMLRELFDDEESPNKIVIPLEHQYTEVGLDPGALKGADRARVEVLARAAEALNYECSLALVTHYQTGIPSYDSWTPSYYRSRGRRYKEWDEPEEEDADDAEMEDVIEEYITLAHWRDMDGRERPFGELGVDDDELLCGEEREGWSVQQEIQEATGNEGASMQRWYRQCALVIWPRDRFFAILAFEGQGHALPQLEQMAAEAADDEARAACRTFAGTIIGYWSRSVSPNGGGGWPERMLTVLVQIGTVELAQRFVRVVLPHDYAGRDGEALRQLCLRFGWEALLTPLTELVQRQQPGTRSVAPTALLSLLAPLYARPADWSAEHRAACISLAREVAKALERWYANAAPPEVGTGQVAMPGQNSRWLGFFPARTPAQPGLVGNAVRLLSHGSDSRPLDEFVDRALRGELGCPLHEVLIPDVKAIAGWLPEVPEARQSYTRLREHCLAQLRAATAAPVLPPADWRRDAELNCKCENCQALARFLADPKTPLARFPLRQELRQHLHVQIEHGGIDCTHVTERKGRPYTLVCQKTNASYERRKQQYELDQMLLEEVSGLPD